MIFETTSSRADQEPEVNKTQRINKPAKSKKSGAKFMRQLKWNELVRSGDYVKAVRGGFALWDGPVGFRADAFVKQIYRQTRSRAVAKLKTRLRNH